MSTGRRRRRPHATEGKKTNNAIKALSTHFVNKKSL
jgi:hypothetical protein